MLIASFLLLGWLSYCFADVNLNLTKGILEGKIQPVFDAIVQKADVNFIVNSSYLLQNNLSLPWVDFHSAPVFHFAFGGGTEAYFRIAAMLLSANADPNLHSVDYPPAILFALGFGKKQTNQDMAATMQGIFQNKKYLDMFHFGESLASYHLLRNYTSNPSLLEYTIANKFIHGAYTLLNDAKVDINQKNNNNYSAFHYAAYHGYSTFIDLFMKQNTLDIHSTDSYGRTALHYAVIRGHLPVLKSILDFPNLSRIDKKKLLTTQDKNKLNALQLALLPPINTQTVSYLVPIYDLLSLSLPKLPPKFDRLIESEFDDEVDGTYSTQVSTQSVTQIQDFNQITQLSADFSVKHGWRCSNHLTSLDTEILEHITAGLNQNTANKASKHKNDLLNQVDIIYFSDLAQSMFVTNYLTTQKPLLITGNFSTQNNKKDSTAFVKVDGTVTSSSSISDLPNTDTTQSSDAVTSNDIWQCVNKDTFAKHYADIKMFTVSSDKNGVNAPSKVGMKDYLTKLNKQKELKCNGDDDNSVSCVGAAEVGKEGTQIAQSLLSDAKNKNKLLRDIAGYTKFFSMCHTTNRVNETIGGDNDISKRYTQSSSVFDDVQLSVGGYSSGEAAHGHGNSYEVQLTGRRKVVLIPPGALGPREYSWGIDSQVLLHYDQLLSFRETGTVYVVYQQPGDVLFIPAGWLHATVNLCDVVTISAEFCSGVVDLEDSSGMSVPYDITTQLYGKL